MPNQMAGDRAGEMGEDAMPYMNRNSGNTRSATVVAVTTLHVAAAVVLINGLGIDYIKQEVFNLPATNYPSEPPPPVPEPPKAEPS